MPPDIPLIATIIAGLVLAFLLGALASRLKLPPLIGYLAAGIVVGPHTPGFFADPALVGQVAEIGLVLLLFGVGLQVSLRDLMAVRALPLVGALVQLAGTTLLGLGLGLLLGWGTGGGLVLGLALAVASSVVLLRVLQDRHLLESGRGRIAIGWLTVQNLVMVLALVLLPLFAPLLGGTALDLHDPFVGFVERLVGAPLGLAGTLAVTAVKLAAFVGFMLIVGQFLVPQALHFVVRGGSRELFRLAVLALALAIAGIASYLFGASLALGALVAGMILAEDPLTRRTARETLPLREAYPVLFFLALGMLFDPAVLWQQPLALLGALFVILVAKPALTALVILAFRRPAATALTVGAGLAQIGEFSLILASLGAGLGLLLPEGRDLILAATVLAILVNPLLFVLADRLLPAVEARLGEPGPPGRPLAGDRQEPQLGPGPELPPEPASAAAAPRRTMLTGHAVLVGYGRVGSVIAEGLRAAGQPFLVIEAADSRVEAARAEGFEVIAGNAATPGPLRQAHVEGATTLIVAIPDPFEAGQAVAQGRRANAAALIIARAGSEAEAAHLEGLGANITVMGEREIAAAMLDLVNPEQIAAAAPTPADAVAAAIAPHGTKPLRSLRRQPERTLSDIDEEELARALGMPPEPGTGPAAPSPATPATTEPYGPAAPTELVAEPAPAPAAEAGSIGEADSVDADVVSEAPAPSGPAAPPRHAEVVPFRHRGPATAPATPYQDPGGDDTPRGGG